MTSSSSFPPAPSPAVNPPRSRWEYWLVRSGMALLLVLVGFQAHARFGYEMSLRKLQARLAEAETAHHDVELLLSDVPQCIMGWPQCSTQTDSHWHVRTYSWHGLTDTFRIHLPYDGTESRPAVMEVVTADAPMPEEAAVALTGVPSSAASDAMNGPAMSAPRMPATPGMGGEAGMGGGQRPDIMASDADGDGKVSREEATERMAPFFDRIDADADGFLDAEEVAAARRRRSRPPGAEPDGSAASNRPEAEPVESPVDAAAPANASGESAERNP